MFKSKFYKNCVVHILNNQKLTFSKEKNGCWIWKLQFYNISHLEKSLKFFFIATQVFTRVSLNILKGILEVFFSFVTNFTPYWHAAKMAMCLHVSWHPSGVARNRVKISWTFEVYIGLVWAKADGRPDPPRTPRTRVKINLSQSDTEVNLLCGILLLQEDVYYP